MAPSVIQQNLSFKSKNLHSLVKCIAAMNLDTLFLTPRSPIVLIPT